MKKTNDMVSDASTGNIKGIFWKGNYFEIIIFSFWVSDILNGPCRMIYPNGDM
jgi:hypothetical protein